jgi:nucleotide-binding universal stress UspA family protein
MLVHAEPGQVMMAWPARHEYATATKEVAPMEEIVVGVDGSAASDAALRFGAQEARDHGCRLVAVHAWSMPVLVSNMFAPVPVIDPGELEGVAKEVLTQALDRVMGPEGPRDMAVDTVVAHGQAADELLQRAAGARELVVGSRGRGGFAQLLLGSVSQQCAHHATCPVVIVPATSTRDPV